MIDDDELVRAAIERYFRGHATRDSAHFRAAFLRSARIEGIREGHLVSWTLDQYCKLFDGRPVPDEPRRRRTVDAVSVSGTAASAVATLVHGDTTFTDYFVLLRTGGAWRIASKVYNARSTVSSPSR